MRILESYPLHIFKKSLKHKSNFVYLVPLIWYFCLFPGRLGYDYALLARIIRLDEQTSWWSSSFFWFFKFTSFKANSIALTSLFGLLALTHAVSVLIKSLGLNPQIEKKLLFLFFLNPLFGVFGLTVSHDVFQTSSILLLTAALISSYISKESNILILLLAGVYSTATNYGFIIFIFSIFFVKGISFKKRCSLIIPSLLITLLSGAFISQESNLTIRKDSFVRNWILIDLKCIVQHPEADIKVTEWSVLQKYAPIQAWREQVSCSNPDVLAQPLNLTTVKTPLDISLVKTFLKISTREPAIIFMSHIQRSRVALPPPFFQAPSNQVDLNIEHPIGSGTNTALQSGPGILHISIDDPVLSNRPSFLRPFEALALLPVFILNQASWFWSWGGLWLYPIMIFLFRAKKVIIRFSQILRILAPTLFLHLLIVVSGPSSLGRYVMSTVLMGNLFAVLFIVQGYEKRFGEK